jgi:hypothetical protein
MKVARPCQLDMLGYVWIAVIVMGCRGGKPRSFDGNRCIEQRGKLINDDQRGCHCMANAQTAQRRGKRCNPGSKGSPGESNSLPIGIGPSRAYKPEHFLEYPSETLIVSTPRCANCRSQLVEFGAAC